MSRVHELGRLNRAQLVGEWLAACKAGDGRIARQVMAAATNEQLIVQIIGAEEARAAAVAAAVARRAERRGL